MRLNRELLVRAGALLLPLILAGMFLEGCGRPEQGHASGAQPAGAMIAGTLKPSYPAPDFSLPGSDGSTVTLQRYRGKVVLLTFGFTHCAAVCPTTMAALAQARAGLGKAAEQVQVVFVTVDPERDDAGHMQRFLAAFDPSFIGATGAPDVLAQVRKAYGVTAVRQGAGPDYAMAHTSSIFLIDRHGKLRAVMPFGHEADDFVHDIKLLSAG